MINIWNTLTEAQAILLSGLLTVLAAGAAVALGGWIFGGRVNNLESAINKTESLLNAHVENLRKKLEEISDLSDAAARNTSTRQGIEEDHEDLDINRDTHSDSQIEINQQFQEAWASIKNRLEKIAYSEKIDGRTRAKYYRIDKRNYQTLLDALEKDEGVVNGVNLEGSADIFREAIKLRQSFKNGKKAVEKSDVKNMQDFKGRIFNGD